MQRAAAVRLPPVEGGGRGARLVAGDIANCQARGRGVSVPLAGLAAAATRAPPTWRVMTHLPAQIAYKTGDLFTSSTALVHCVSKDLALGEMPIAIRYAPAPTLCIGPWRWPLCGVCVCPDAPTRAGKGIALKFKEKFGMGDMKSQRKGARSQQGGHAGPGPSRSPPRAPADPPQTWARWPRSGTKRRSAGSSL